MEEDNNTRSSKFRRICVFCGSNSGYRQVCSDSALELVKRKIDLVYGGGSVGLMGLISQKVYHGGCHVLGIIPKALMPLEISGQTVGEVRTVSDMHERKAAMARESNAFVALPGGYGTMEELLEMITWSQLGIHKKPVGLLNVDGYYNCLLLLFDNDVEEGFIKPSARSIVVSAPTAKELLEKMEQYTPSHSTSLLMKAGIWNSSSTIQHKRMHSEKFVVGRSLKLIHDVTLHHSVCELEYFQMGSLCFWNCLSFEFN